MDNYICIRVYNEKNENSDFPLSTSMVFKAKENLLYEAAVPVSKTAQFKENNNPFFGQSLVFEIGDKKILPELWADWISY